MYVRYPLPHHFPTREDYELALDEWNSNPKSFKQIVAERKYKADRANDQKKYEEWLKRKENKMKSLTASVTKRQNSPDFVIGSFGFKFDDLIPYMNAKGYINFDILKGKEFGQYVKVSDYGIEKEPQKKEEPIVNFDDEEIPF